MNFSFLKRKSPTLVGVDISSVAIKMVELADDSHGGYKLKSCATQTLSSEAILDGNINDLEKSIETMQSTWKSLATNEKRVALALPSAAVISKKVQMPTGLTEADMEAQVESVASQYIPFSIDEMSIDYQILGPIADNPDEVEVLIVASNKDKIEDRVAVAEGAGLKAIVVDVESYAIEAAYTLVAKQLPNAGQELTVMIVNIGLALIHITVLHDNKAVYTRDHSFDGGRLRQEIQNRFGLSSAEAELAKVKGGLPDSYEIEVLAPFLKTIVTEIASALQTFTSTTKYDDVDHILLAGDCEAMSLLATLLQEQTQINTLIANPFTGMTIDAKLNQQQVSKDAASMLIACGLAMREGLAV